MLSPFVGQVALGVYAALLAAGGLMGFLKAKSRPSLIAGLVSAFAAIIALILTASGVAFGFPLGLALAVFLFVFFGYRFAAKGRKFMPNGMMAVVSLIVAALLVAVMLDITPPAA